MPTLPGGVVSLAWYRDRERAAATRRLLAAAVEYGDAAAGASDVLDEVAAAEALIRAAARYARAVAAASRNGTATNGAERRGGDA